MKAEKTIVTFIALFTFLVLLYASSSVLLNGSDEENHFFIASSISFKPDSLNLPLGFKELVPHPLLHAYLIKLGFLLFGRESIVSGRFIFVLLGALGIFLVYSLVRRGINRRVALLSIILLSVEKYYICHMRYALSESVCIFFAILTVYIFFMALREDNRALMILAGVNAGVGFYGKENILFLFPIFFIYLLWEKRYRFWLKAKQTYMAVLIFFLISAPFVIYNLQHNLYSIRYITSAAKFGLSPLSATVVFGEPLSFLFDASAIRGMFDCEYPLMNWTLGLTVLCGVVYSALKSRKESLIKLLLVIFFFIFIIFSLVSYMPETEPNSLFNGQNWVSMMVIPGIVLCANMLTRLWDRYRWGRIFIIALVLYLGYDMIRLINLPESFYIPRKNIMLEELRDLAGYDLVRGHYGYAKKRYERLQRWSKDGAHLEEARLSLLYLSMVAEREGIREYYLPAKDILPEEMMRQADFFFSAGAEQVAVDRYQKVIRLAPYETDTGRAYNNSGLIYARQGDLELARQQWKKALQADPQNEAAKGNLKRYSEEPY